MLRQMYTFLVGRSWLRKVLLTTPGVRQLVWRFIAGENLGTGLSIVRKLNARGIKGSLNYVGTHVHTEAAAAAAADAAIEAVARLHNDALDAHLSIKLTQIGLDIGEELCQRHLQRVLDGAARTEIFVCIDMEESVYVDRTLRLFEKMRDVYGADRIGIAVQSYLRYRRGDLQRLLAAGARVRLVKGGYWEPAVTYHKKTDVDRLFGEDIDLVMSRGRHPAIATHDARFIAQAQQAASAAGLGKGDFEFEMLYGVRPDLQRRLVAEGYRVRCYVPYGGDWLAYFLGCARRIPAGLLDRLRRR